MWGLIAARQAGFPWLAIAGKLLAGWLVIDLDGTLITARSDKEGAAPTFKMGYGFHPLGAWCANTAESLAMLLRPGNARLRTPSPITSRCLPWRSARSPPGCARGCWSASTGPVPATS